MQSKKWERIVERTCRQVRWHFPLIYNAVQFGAYIKPENYFVSYIFKTNQKLLDAETSGLQKEIIDYHRKRMLANGYPEEAVSDCVFASQEDCDEKNNGNWYYYYK